MAQSGDKLAQQFEPLAGKIERRPFRTPKRPLRFAQGTDRVGWFADLYRRRRH